MVQDYSFDGRVYQDLDLCQGRTRTASPDCLPRTQPQWRDCLPNLESSWQFTRRQGLFRQLQWLQLEESIAPITGKCTCLCLQWVSLHRWSQPWDQHNIPGGWLSLQQSKEADDSKLENHPVRSEIQDDLAREQTGESPSHCFDLRLPSCLTVNHAADKTHFWRWTKWHQPVHSDVLKLWPSGGGWSVKDELQSAGASEVLPIQTRQDGHVWPGFSLNP